MNINNISNLNTNINKLANREALMAILLAILYALWWAFSAYFPTAIGSSLPTLYFGLPLWFLLSCIIGPLLFMLLGVVMVLFFFKDISIETP